MSNDDLWRDRPVLVTARTFLRLDGTLVLGRVSEGVGTLGEPLWSGGWRLPRRRRDARDLDAHSLWHWCYPGIGQQPEAVFLTSRDIRDVQNGWRHIR